MNSHDEEPFDQAVAAIANKQFGVFARWQARELGASRNQIARRLSSGLWACVHPGVVRLVGAPQTRAQMAVAARLYAGKQACFSHITAARLHGFEPQITDKQIWLTVPAQVKRPQRPGMRIMRSRRVDGETTTAHNQPVLSIARTIIDLATVMDEPSFVRMLYDVFHRGLVVADDVLSAVEDFGGRVGTALVRKAITEFDPHFGSGLEVEAAEVLKALGLDLERQVKIMVDGVVVAILDFASRELRLGIEVDGARFHTSVAASHYDRERDRALRRQGWHIERFTTADIRDRPQVTVRHLAAIIEQRRNEIP